MAIDSSNEQLSRTFRAILPLPPKKQPLIKVQFDCVPAAPKPDLEAFEKSSSKLARSKYWRSPAGQFSIPLTFRAPGNVTEILFPSAIQVSIDDLGHHMPARIHMPAMDAAYCQANGAYPNGEGMQTDAEDYHATSKRIEVSSKEFQPGTEESQVSSIIRNDSTSPGVKAENFYNTFNVFSAKPYTHKTRAPAYYAGAHLRSDVDSQPWWSESRVPAKAGLARSGENASSDAIFDCRPVSRQPKTRVCE